MSTAVETFEPAKPGSITRMEGRVVVTPLEMLDRATAQNAPVEILERLMALHERYEANRARQAFDAALASAKAEIPVILKNRTVDFTSQKGRTNYRHEDLAEIARTIDPILAKHGLSYRFRTKTEGGTATVTCIVSHRDGHSEENTLSAGHDNSGNKNSIQAVGSAITYLQRYTLKASLGLSASDDDDGKTTEPEVKVISHEQAEEIRDLIGKTSSNIDVFLKALKVESVADIPAKEYFRVIGMFTEKMKRVPQP
ncbi:MAG: ERF family protein [Chelatococcus sp.]|uniref:ERF family protein n=1 Tax=Chelatococcus sp. TaxID=1953771 RepID=UPI002617D1A3|nr:ERF family protein [Chelatococcus sp.]MCO5079198.1 ERF family protein [Chelatococcus sp.]